MMLHTEGIRPIPAILLNYGTSRLPLKTDDRKFTSLQYVKLSSERVKADIRLQKETTPMNLSLFLV